MEPTTRQLPSGLFIVEIPEEPAKPTDTGATLMGYPIVVNSDLSVPGGDIVFGPSSDEPTHCQHCNRERSIPSSNSGIRHFFTCRHEKAYTCRDCLDAGKYARCSMCGSSEEYT